jgi:hypothetical protein
MPNYPKPPADDDAPTTYYEIEQRKRLNPEPGEERGDAVQHYPKLPATNPWAQENPPEPTIDRREDADHFIPETQTED